MGCRASALAINTATVRIALNVARSEYGDSTGGISKLP
jgi:hypothetical protein